MDLTEGLNVISQAKRQSAPGNSSLHEKLELKTLPAFELAGWKTFAIQTLNKKPARKQEGRKPGFLVAVCVPGPHSLEIDLLPMLEKKFK